jgi:hypothetical protein
MDVEGNTSVIIRSTIQALAIQWLRKTAKDLVKDSRYFSPGPPPSGCTKLAHMKLITHISECVKMLRYHKWIIRLLLIITDDYTYFPNQFWMCCVQSLLLFTIKGLSTFTATYAIMKSVLQSPDGQTHMRTLFENRNIAKRSLSWNAVRCGVTNVKVLIAKHPMRLLSKTVISHIYWGSKWMIYDLVLRSVFLRTLHKTLFPISNSHTHTHTLLCYHDRTLPATMWRCDLYPFTPV